jgi:hypothetical protein
MPSRRSLRGVVGVGLSELMSMIAVRLGRVDGGGGNRAPERVLAFRDRLKVSGIDASPVAAEMVDVQPVRNGSDEQFVSHPVRFDELPVTPYVSIAPHVTAGGPFPTARGHYFVLGVESLKQCAHVGMVTSVSDIEVTDA